jgi:hypothetical protein
MSTKGNEKEPTVSASATSGSPKWRSRDLGKRKECWGLEEVDAIVERVIGELWSKGWWWSRCGYVVKLSALAPLEVLQGAGRDQLLLNALNLEKTYSFLFIHLYPLRQILYPLRQTLYPLPNTNKYLWKYSCIPNNNRNHHWQ